MMFPIEFPTRFFYKYMESNRRKPRIGIFTRPIDQGTSGSGHHLLEMISRVLERNTRFEIFLIHYERNDREIYRHAPEIVIPRNPLRPRRF